MQPIWIFRHIECEGPGYLSVIFDRYSLPYKIFAVDAHCPIPDTVDGAAGLVLLGGPMSVNDADEWISREIGLIQQAQQRDLPVLGHCLGAQLIAKAMGAVVHANPVTEIGWHPVCKSDQGAGHPLLGDLPVCFDVFHWHGETFTLPKHATPLLYSEFCAHQAFAVGKTLALQCHLEVLPDMVDQWSALYAEQLRTTAPSIQSRADMLDNAVLRCNEMHRLADTLYDNWLKYSKLI